MRMLWIVAACCGVWSAARADVVVGYVSSNAESVAPSAEAAGIVGDNLSAGPGLSLSSGSTFNFRGWPQDGAYAPEDYFEWGFSVQPGSQVSVTGVNLRYDRSASGPAGLAIYVSTNAFISSSLLFGDLAVDENGEEQTIALNQTIPANGSLHFRLYGWNASSTLGTLDLENVTAWGDTCLQVNGSVTAIPEPSAAVLLACAGLVSWQRHRRRRATESC